MPSFDGSNLIITLDSGVINVDVQVDLYSDWKEFFKTGLNSRFNLGFRTVGGDDLPGVIDAGDYYFIRNDLGWRIRPAEENATINFIGNLVPQDPTLPIMIPTIGGFTVLINGIQPITQRVDILNAADGVESGITLKQSQRVILSAAGGKASGLNVNLPKYRNPADTKDRIVAVTDASGNRTSVTLDTS